MDYQEYCRHYNSEQELSYILSMVMLVDGTVERGTVFSDIVERFICTQHYASLMHHHFYYIGEADGGVLFEWKNEETDWAAGEEAYRIGCVVSDRKEDRYTLRIYNMETGDYSTESYSKVWEAITRVQELLGIRGRATEVPEIPEADEEQEHTELPDNYYVTDVQDLVDKENDDAWKRINKKLKIVEKQLLSEYDQNVVAERMKFVKKIINKMMDDFVGMYIQNISTKDGNIRLMCYDEFSEKVSINVSMDINDHSMKVILNKPVEASAGKKVCRTTDYEDIIEIVSEVIYGTD